MNVDWAVTCRYAESDGTVATLVGAGTDVAFVPQFPAPVAMMMAVRLAVPREDLESGRAYACRCQVLDPENRPVRAPDDTEVPTLELIIQYEGPIQQIVPGWLVNPLVTFGVQWWAATPGTYTIAVSIDGGEPHLSPYHVVQPQ